MNMIPQTKFYSHDHLIPEKTNREKELWKILLKDSNELLEEMDLLKYLIGP